MRLPLLCAALAACSSPSSDADLSGVIAERQIPAALQADATAIANANNQFACDVYAQLATDDANRLFSPFSIFTALAMTDAGAAGTTDLELRTALHLDLPGDRAHLAMAAMLASLDIGRAHGAYTLSTANGLFSQVGFPLLPAFTKTLTDSYAAEPKEVDFVGAPEAARATVNQWVDSKTDHKIPALFDDGTLDADDRLVVANAVVFKGTWDQKFKTSDTATAAFHLATGETIQVPTMRKTDAVATKPIPGGVLAVLPFHGKDLSMVLVVPTTLDGLPAIEAQLSGTTVAQWMANIPAAHEHLEIQLPKFSLTDAPDLIPVLTALGVTAAFDPLAADLSAIDGQHDLYVAQLAHKAMLDINEDGAEAAAATGTGASTTSAPSPVVADRPFVFFLYDHVTGSILFLGRVEDPRA